MPPDLSIASLGILYPTFKKAVKVRLLKSATDESLNVTVVEFSNKEDGKLIIQFIAVVATCDMIIL